MMCTLPFFNYTQHKRERERERARERERDKRVKNIGDERERQLPLGADPSSSSNKHSLLRRFF